MAVIKVPVALGGTGADNAADARANLGISSNTSGGAYSGIFVSNAQIKSSNVSGNVTINTGNVMLSKAGANVTFEVPGSTVVGAQFKTPGIHDLATQRIVTIKSNNYSANRLLDYRVPTVNIKAKYNNVSINTAGRILFSNRFDDEASMPSTSKYEGFIAFDRNPGSVGDLYVSNALQRHKILIANTDLTPGTNNFYSIGTEALRWKNLKVSNDISSASGNVLARGITIGEAAIYYSEADAEENGVRIGFNTSTPEYIGLNANCNVYISGNLVVAGNVYVKNTQHLIVSDPIIELGSNTTGAPTLDMGILMNRGSASNAFIGFDESRDEMAVAFTADPSSVTTINIAGYTTLRANSAILAVEGDTKKTNFSKVAIGTASPGPYKLDVRGNANVGAMTITGTTTHASYSHFPDDVKVLWGHDPTGVVSDLEMYHGGTHSFIKNKTGDLRIKSDSILLKNQADDETYLDANNGGSIDLYFDNTKKLETTGTGVIVSGLGANLAGNTSVSRSLAVGYTAHRVPQANLDVKGNAYVTGAMSINDGEAVASEGLALAYAIALG